MLRKRTRLLEETEESEPMSYTVNIVDCMLVLAVGFMLFAVMSMDMQSVIFSDMSPEEKAQVTETIKNTIQLEQGQEVPNDIDNISDSGGDQYSQVGTVYKDPTTGKMVMIPN